MPFTFQNFCCDPRFRVPYAGQRKIERFHNSELCIKFRLPLDENLHGFFHIVAAIVNRLIYFFLCQLPVNIEWHIRFFNVGTHESFQRFQANGRVRHTVIVVKRDVPHQRTELPRFVSFNDDPIIQFFRIQAAQDAFQNPLIIVTAVIANPDIVDVPVIEFLQFFGAVDYWENAFCFGVRYDNKPIILEHLKIIENHCHSPLFSYPPPIPAPLLGVEPEGRKSFQNP